MQIADIATNSYNALRSENTAIYHIGMYITRVDTYIYIYIYIYIHIHIHIYIFIYYHV